MGKKNVKRTSGQDHPIYKQTLYRGLSNYDILQVHIILATDGYSDLTRWCLINAKRWTVDMELEMVQILAFFGHSMTAEIFLRPENIYLFLSNVNAGYHSAMLGAAEAGHHHDLLHYLEAHDAPSDVVGGNDEELPSDLDHEE